MKKILKFKLPIIEKIPSVVEVEMPTAATVLSVAVVRGEPCVSAICDPARAKSKRKFRVFATGDEIKITKLGAYIGTIQLKDGWRVLHIFKF